MEQTMFRVYWPEIYVVVARRQVGSCSGARNEATLFRAVYHYRHAPQSHARLRFIAESVPRLDREKDPDQADSKCNDAERGHDQKPRWHLRFVVLNFLSHSVLPSAVTSGRGKLKTLAPKMVDLTSVSPQLPKRISHPFPHSRCLSLPDAPQPPPLHRKNRSYYVRRAEPRGSSII